MCFWQIIRPSFFRIGIICGPDIHVEWCFTAWHRSWFYSTGGIHVDIRCIMSSCRLSPISAIWWRSVQQIVSLRHIKRFPKVSGSSIGFPDCFKSIFSSVRFPMYARRIPLFLTCNCHRFKLLFLSGNMFPIIFCQNISATNPHLQRNIAHSFSNMTLMRLLDMSVPLFSVINFYWETINPPFLCTLLGFLLYWFCFLLWIQEVGLNSKTQVSWIRRINRHLWSNTWGYY